jgi:tetratricopeptide (TPR) repeat protein/serine/threonine protein kinase
MAADANKVRELFLHAVGKLPPEQWAEYVAEATCGDAELQRQVMHLLDVHRQAGSFLDRPVEAPGHTGVFTPAPESDSTAAVREESGAVIGPYKLLQPIGEGGMGSVWMAEQTHPVQRKVALKIIKAGMDTRQVIARFEAERQALALMDHPSIARVLDAGTTQSGRPYFVMELIKGVPITTYCDDHRLTPRERLKLFIPVCQAVQHAHQKGIIHRDLKPTNVLIALYDGKPVPKVIDFGIAKATGQKLTDRTLFTGLGQVVGTLEYMSPEQAELNQLDIDTRSDIYSLGVLLYELLTGTTPLDRKRLKQAAMVELLRLIREEEPPRPSTRLSTTEELPSVAANRGLEPKKLSGVVRGELDWIVMKALEKDRNRRYETANGFARDVQRYLADEPVLACPPSAAYRLRKFVRRHQAGLVTTAALLLVVLLAGGSIGWVLWDRAVQQAARRATTERTVSVALGRAAELSEQAHQMPSASSVEAAAVLVVWQKAQDALAQAETALTTGADDDVLRQRVAELRAQLDRGQARAVRKEQLFRDLDEARLAHSVWIDEHFDYAGSATRYAAAFAAYGLEVTPERKDELAKQIAAEEPEVREALFTALLDWAFAAYQVSNGSGKDLLELAKTADSNTWQKQFVTALARHDGPALRKLSVEARRSSWPPSGLVVLANTLLGSGAHEESLALLRWGRGRHPSDFWLHLELGDQLCSGKRETPTSVEFEEGIGCYRAVLALRPETPAVLNNLGYALRDKGQLDEAIAAYREAIRLKKDFAGAHSNLGIALQDKGELDKAIDEYQEAIRLKKNFAEAHSNLGDALREKGQLDEAIAACREAIRLKKDHAPAHANLGIALRAKGQLDEAIAACCEAIRLKKDSPNPHNNLGYALQAKGQLDEAIAAYREAIRLKKNFAMAHNNLGSALHAKGQFDDAIAAYREAVRLKKDSAEYHNDLGTALKDKGQLDEAIAAYRKAIRLNKDLANAHYNLGLALHDKGQLDEAIAAYREAIHLKKDNADAHCGLAMALQAKGQLVQAIREYREAIRFKKDFAAAQTNLGIALRDNGQLDEAIAEFREAIRLKKDDAVCHYHLGLALHDKGRLDEAIAAYREAIGLKKDFADAHLSLGNALTANGRLEEAIEACREAIRLNKDSAMAHNNLGNALAAKGRLDEAIAAYRDAISLKQDFAMPHANLGSALLEKGQFDEAIEELQEAIRLKKDYREAHGNLGNALAAKGRLDEAIAEYREVIQLKKDDPLAHCNLGRAFMQNGQFREALEELHRGHELGSRLPGWRYPSAQRVRDCERLLELDGKLPAILQGNKKPASPAECIELAGLCSLKRLHRAAARFYEEAFDAQPKLADGVFAPNRYGAACAAALAAAGQGEDAARLDDTERARLRKQALDWLRADLVEYAKRLEGGTRVMRRTLRQQVEHWQNDTALAGIRDSSALAKLPAAERASFEKLWADVADTLARAQATKPPKKSDSK